IPPSPTPYSLTHSSSAMPARRPPPPRAHHRARRLLRIASDLVDRVDRPVVRWRDVPVAYVWARRGNRTRVTVRQYPIEHEGARERAAPKAVHTRRQRRGRDLAQRAEAARIACHQERDERPDRIVE